ncbi:MAG: hypothetical protein IPK76_22790 [Lewinellaceae bacterium]|jgi:hypothetical protein|nr:hypothetical protein [Lewinellaceae bacterium]
MKSVFLKINFLALALILVSSAALTSCKKDNDTKPEPQESLSGAWTIQSFTIDGVEVKGLVIKSSQLKLNAADEASGTFVWTITYMDNTADTVKGQYLLNESGDEISMITPDGQVQVFDFSFTGDQIVLSGMLDEGTVVMKAGRG